MADELRSYAGVSMRFVDMGNGADGKPWWAQARVSTGNVASGVADNGNPVKVGGVYLITPPTLTTTWRTDFLTDNSGNLRVRAHGGIVTAADAVANTALVSMQGGSDAGNGVNVRPMIVAQYIFNGTTWDRLTASNLTARLLSAAGTTNATSVKGSAGKVFKIFANVAAAADKFLKLYNKATAPTVGTDTPVLTLTLPASTKNVQFDLGCYGLHFSAGIAYAITGAIADADTTALTAGDVTGLNITYA